MISSKEQKNIDDMTPEELKDKIVKLESSLKQLRKDYLANHAYCQRLMKGISTVLEPVVLFHLSPWVNSNSYISTFDKKTIMLHLVKLCLSAARVLSPQSVKKQLSTLVSQCYATFIETYDLFDYNAKITWKGLTFRVKDKNGVDPYVLQIGGEKGVFHKASLGKLLKAMSEDVGEVEGALEDDNG